MSKNTYAEVLTFQDPDLTTPQHDEIMCWLDGKMPEVLNMLLGEDPRRTLIEKIWEYPVTHRTGYNGGTISKVGHVDMLVKFKYTRRCVEWVEPGMCHAPQCSNVGKAYGCYSSGCPVDHRNYEGVWSLHDALVFEVKPKIQSLGELLRQIRHYQSYLEGMYVVVSPDTRFKEQLQSQGVGFIHSGLVGTAGTVVSGRAISEAREGWGQTLPHPLWAERETMDEDVPVYTKHPGSVA